MIITFWKGIFVADSPDEKGDLKRAGFMLHEPSTCSGGERSCKACRAKIGRRFWADKVEAATRMRAFCNELARKATKEHIDRLAKSRATDSDIVVPAPPGLSYLPYQKAGIAYAIQHVDTLIGDDMGLGKTIQVLGFVNKSEPKNVLIVCPRTLIWNWREEAKKWLVKPYDIITADSKQLELPKKDGLFVIVNYEKLVGDSPLTRSLARKWDVAAYDECHMIKNIYAKRSQAILGQEGLMRRAHRNLFLTGTPIENYPREIWPIAAAISPAKFGDWWEFAHRYCGLHQEERRGKKTWVADGATNLPELQQRLRSTFMIRRLKKDVLTDLPPKRRQLVMLEDSKIEWAKHPQFKRWKEIYEKQYEKAMASLEAATTEVAYKAAVLSLEKFTGIAFEEMSEFRHATALAKLPLAIKYLDYLLVSGVERFVVFAHHVDVLKKLYEHFRADAVLVSGGVSEKTREAAVKDFQAGKKKIFIGQTRAAGVGITLTAANVVVFVESDWVPGVLSQAEDRLCRIGQRNMVHVIHLILGNTLDANMTRRVVEKQAIIDRALDTMPDLKMKLPVQGSLPLH